LINTYIFNEMSLIIKYKHPYYDRKTRVRDEPRIERVYTKFKIDYGKCRSYLDIHYPQLELTDEILARCKTVMVRTLYSCARYGEEDGYFWANGFSWRGLKKYNYDDVFDKIFYAKEMILDFTDEHCDGDMIGLEHLITDNNYYEEFNRRYPSYALGEILTTLVLSSQAILRESTYYASGFPQEIAEKIVCDAFALLSGD
jgi:hypothetical protein